MQKQRILITGATGFVGRYLFTQLTEQGREPIGISKNGGTVAGRPVAAAEITDEKALNAFLDQNPVDYIFHLACFIPRIQDKDDFHNCWLVNAFGTRNLMRAAAAHGVKRFVYASSQTVCNGAHRTNVKEDDIEAPNSEYGVTKLAGEHLCKIHAARSMSLIILRYSSVYGFGQLPSVVLSIFVEKIMNHQPVTVWGDGGSTYDFVYVKDVAEATILTGLSDQTGIFNIGSGRETSVKTLADALKKLCPRAVITYDPSRPDAGRRFCFNIEKLQTTFGFTPRYRLADGLREYLNMFHESICLKK